MDDFEAVLELVGPIAAAISVLMCVALIVFAWRERRERINHHRELMARNGERWRNR